jgi:hypothetical protein
MRGTLREGDRLQVRSVLFPSLEPGDVVAFRSGGKVMVHRIYSRDEQELWTRGDGNHRGDSVSVKPDQLIGKVVMRECAGTLISVAGGAAGRRRAILMRTFLFVRRGFGIPYRWIRASRMIPLFWKPRIQTVRFALLEGGQIKCIHRGKTVGVWSPQEHRWICQKPYDLLCLEPPR